MVLRELVLEYHRDTETFDRIVCTGPIVKDSIQPATMLERRMITEHAIKRRERLFSEGGRLGFTSQQIQKMLTREA